MIYETVVDRPRYWARLQLWVGKSLIKVLTGQRRDREFGVLLDLPGNHPKLVVSLDPLTADDRGVRHVGLRRFLRDGTG